MNLLTEPVFRVQATAGAMAMSLPGLLAALGADAVGSLPGLQRHQEDAFHIFLCYLAGAVLARAGVQNPVQPEAFWRAGLRQLAGRDDDCAWALVVEEVTQPAFMQAPLVNKADWAAFKPKADTPDALDVLPTAKNHDLKATRVINAAAEAWIYALVSLQTMSGFFGQGNYGIARMNGGFGSRPCVGLWKNERPGGRFQREVHRLLDVRLELLNPPYPYLTDGRVLLWVLPWDRASSLDLKTLDPFFIEIARSVRLVSSAGQMRAWSASTSAARLGAKALNGLVGDPWIPINLKTNGALTVSDTGFTPELVHNLLFEQGFVAAAMQQPIAAETSVMGFYTAVLIRGQGKTDGFHSVVLPIPAKARSALFRRGAERQRLADLSKRGLNDAADMQRKVLKPALYAWLEAGEVSAWVEQAGHLFTARWQPAFFDWLWGTVDTTGDDVARLPWLQTLEGNARDTLADAIARFPARTGRYYRSRVRANGVFSGCLFKIFPELKEITDARRRTVTDATCP
ncbi:MAG: type I-E CRISPR-associated protein Cse1/CasA [Gammaproteobacteria bacterium]|nr:type I-E CRISPR-associated protein Cse1/CasA [Gammaproteobacteria bacterium]